MELFNFRNGKLEKIQPAPKLPIGCKVRIFAGPCDEYDGAIISEPNQYGNVEIVKLCNYSAGFRQSDIRHTQPLSKKFGIGIYYYDSLEIVDAEIIAEFVAKGKAADEKEAAETLARKLADEAEIAALPALYPKLTPVYNHDRKTTKKNLVTELKENFPDVKFSVKTDYSSCNISWTNGATESEVKQIVNKFIDSESSDCGDYRDLNQSNFNKVFGGFNYVFTNRKMGEDIVALVGDMKSLLIEESNFHDYPEQILYQIFARTSLKKGAKVIGIKRNDLSIRIKREEAFDLIIEEVEEKAPTQEKIFDGVVEVVAYSEKALAVFGETKPIKDKLKALGGRFNPFLLNNGEKMAGWIFPKSKEMELLAILN